MKLFKLISDTHFELFPSDDEVLKFIDELLCDKESQETVLLHAGDLHCVSKLNWVLDELAQRFAQVVYVPGNREACGASSSALSDRLKEVQRENLHVLDPGVVKFDDVTIVGATLWTSFLNKSPEFVNEATCHLRDLSCIGGLAPKSFAAMQRQDAAFINKQLRKTGRGKTICLTHQFPSYNCLHPKYKTFPTALLNFGFASEFDEIILGFQPNYWLFGHTHESVSIKMNSTAIMANPFGCRGSEENPKFDPKFVVEL